MEIYRNKHRLNYIRRVKIEEFCIKYANKFEFNKIKLAVIRIQRFMRKALFIEPVNEYKHILPLHRYRLKITFNNLFENKNEDQEFKDVILSTMEYIPSNDINFILIIDISNPIKKYEYMNNIYYIHKEDLFKIKNIYKKLII